MSEVSPGVRVRSNCAGGSLGLGSPEQHLPGAGSSQERIRQGVGAAGISVGGTNCSRERAEQGRNAVRGEACDGSAVHVWRECSLQVGPQLRWMLSALGLCPNGGYLSQTPNQ